MEYDAMAHTKWVVLLGSAQNREELHALGSQMTVELLLETLEWATQQPTESRQRLLPVLAAIPQKVFSEGFNVLTASHMQVLKQLASEEPVQHHLTLLAHKWAHDAEAQAVHLEQLRKQIASYDVTNAASEDYNAFKQSIEGIQTYFQQTIPLVDKALSLTWMTSREDLIDRFTTLKESWLRYLVEVIGAPADEAESIPSSGVYNALDAHFALVFGDTTNPEQLAALEDTDPGIEALAALAIWNAQDFRDVGLLGHDEYTEEEAVLKVVQERLNSLHLTTVADFKREKIYSKKALQEYVRQF